MINVIVKATVWTGGLFVGVQKHNIQGPSSHAPCPLTAGVRTDPFSVAVQLQAWLFLKLGPLKHCFGDIHG